MERAFCSASLSLALLAAAVAAQEAAPLTPLNPEEKKEEEKPKEPPLKYSAWCAFRDLSDQRPPPKEDPTKDETRMAARMWSGFGRRGQWANVVLELKNTTEKSDFKGTATIQFDPVKENERGVIPYQTYYRQEFEIGPGTVKQYSFSVLCPEEGWTKVLEVYITANGRPYPPRYVQLHDLDALGQDFVVVVSDTAGSFRHLAARRRNVEDDDTRHERRLAVVAPQELPSRWHDLMLANMIVIDGPPREQITEPQWAALKSYVQAGGHILISAGRDPSRLKGPVEELAGITVREMAEVDRLDGGASPDLNWAPRNQAWKLPLVDVSVSPKGSPFVQYSQHTRRVELCRRSYGSGSVTFVPFSLSDPRLETWKGRELIPVQIIEHSRGRRLFSYGQTDQALMGIGPNAGGETPDGPLRANSLMGFRQTLDQSFANDTPVESQKPSFVLGFLLLYLLCAVPGNYLLFGWLKRREIAWLAVPAWAASFSVMAYAVGYMGKTGELTVNEVAVIEAGPGQSMGMSRTFVGVYAPRRDEYRLEFPPVKAGPDEFFDVQAAPGHLVNISRGESRGIDTPPLYIVDTGQTLTIERLLVQQRSTRQLEIVHRTRIGAGLDVSVRHNSGQTDGSGAGGDGNGSYDVEVQNNTGYSLYYPVWVYEGKAHELGTTDDNILPPGASRKLSAITAANGADPAKAFFGKAVVLPSARGPHARNRAMALNEYVRNQTDKYRHGVVCAWIDTERGALPVKVGVGWQEAREPKIEGLSLLLVPISIKTDVAGRAPAGSIKLSHLPEFDLMTGEGPWNVFGDSLQLKREAMPGTIPGYRTPVPPHPNLLPVTTYLKVDLPPNYRTLSYENLQLGLRFKLAVKFSGAPVAPRPRQGQAAPQPPAQDAGPSLTGDVKLLVRRQKENGIFVWTEGADEVVTKIQADTPYQSPVIPLPWTDYRAVSGNALFLRLCYIPNPAQDKSVNYTVQLQEVECTAGKP